ncbi:hypothetical protein [Methylorubrum extorquens]|jgi:hypothetical protein|uniref:Transposase n=1 Tax=Methylorubrum extorquens TaxID=408 RepID=A0AAX3WR37_METEX|nr:hypothetical protein [Methylorubrum extorquens]WHQ72926.1 hypothetical protein KEC54_28075 [Methylorubrum extorquens]
MQSITLAYVGDLHPFKGLNKSSVVKNVQVVDGADGLVLHKYSRLQDGRTAWSVFLQIARAARA